MKNFKWVRARVIISLLMYCVAITFANRVWQVFLILSTWVTSCFVIFVLALKNDLED